MNISIEKKLSSFLLNQIEFKLPSGKSLKRGVLKVINTKQFYIKFSLQTPDKSIKVFEIPYPYKLTVENNICTFDYSLSCLCQDNIELFYKLKASNSKNHSKLYDTCLYLSCL